METNLHSSRDQKNQINYFQTCEIINKFYANLKSSVINPSKGRKKCMRHLALDRHGECVSCRFHLTITVSTSVVANASLRTKSAKIFWVDTWQKWFHFLQANAQQIAAPMVSINNKELFENAVHLYHSWTSFWGFKLSI
jgi:hypothetical protein